METVQKDEGLVGLWVSAEGSMRISADGTALIGGLMFRYRADGQVFTLTGTQGSLQFSYRLDGDTLSYVANGQTIVARRLTRETITALVRAMQRGAGVWAGTESSLDPGLFISWTQYLVLNPDGSVDYAQSEGGASQQQVTDFSARFMYSHASSGYRQSMGSWQSDGVNLILQWNSGALWRGALDVSAGRLDFSGIGRLNAGSDVRFERQRTGLEADLV